MVEFFERLSTEAQCEAALMAAQWPNGFRCPRCTGAARSIIASGGNRPLFQCCACRHQTSLIARTVFQGTTLSLRIWLLAIYLISRAKTGYRHRLSDGNWA